MSPSTESPAAARAASRNRLEAVVSVRAHRLPSESLQAMALRLGVSRIVEALIPFDGGLYNLPNGERIIKLNATSPPTRKRFTLAHEIGHLLLGEPGLRSSCGHNQQLERKCDAIASELLMPTDEAVPLIKNLGKPSPEKLKSIASRFQVSLQAAAFRVHRDLGLWKCFIGCWRRHSAVKTEWFVGYRRRWDRTEPDTYSLDLALASDGPVQSQELWHRGMGAERVWLDLMRLGRSDRVLGLVDFIGRQTPKFSKTRGDRH